jgi:hypothetical protein
MMRARHHLLVATALGATTHSSCDLKGQWPGLNFSVSGRLGGCYWNLQSSVSVMVTSDSDMVSGAFTVVAPDAQLVQSGAFSLPNMPKGTYTVTLVVTSSNPLTPYPTATRRSR